MPLLKNLREVLIGIFLWRWINRLFYAKQVLAEWINSILATLETFDFRDMPQLATATTILIILNMLVRVDYLDHLLLQFVFKLIQCRCWMEEELGVIDQERLLISILMVLINAKQVNNVVLFSGLSERRSILLRITFKDFRLLRHRLIIQVSRSFLMLLAHLDFRVLGLGLFSRGDLLIWGIIDKNMVSTLHLLRANWVYSTLFLVQ